MTQLTYVSSEQLTVSSSAVALTVPTPTSQRVTYALVQVQDADIRVRVDQAPTTSSGLIFEAGSVFEIIGASDINGIEFIRDGSSDAEVFVDYYREAVGTD